MHNRKFAIGAHVYFAAHVFEPPFSPFYDNYCGHKFEVVRYGNEEQHEDPDSVVLRCVIDPNVIVRGNVHEQDLKRAY